MSQTIYVEGGGNGRELKVKCRKGFSSFFGKTTLAGQMPKIVACGSRQNTFNKFKTALAKAANNDSIVMLVDSEDRVDTGFNVWLHLKNRDDWYLPNGATDDHAHLMVQCMESWFLADKDTLANFFGQGFNRNALPARDDVENIPKRDIEVSLERATRQSKKGKYHKGNHSFDTLARIRPNRVTAASPHAKRLVDMLIRNSIGESS